ncbi:hypothetical protein DL764_010552 [Monosporascus ibericus]|uniref:Protein AF-9 homolog n=1 Tax=Monosporascus ibericus TaxID=155417 RepID=A0A4V1X8I3_9PEZI|nr:hypothetical protein DL764_010552 [Monosporascus ibericus]
MSSIPLDSPGIPQARRSMPRRQGRGQTSVWNSAAQAEVGNGLGGSEAQDFESHQTASEEEVAKDDEVAGGSELVHEDDICPICQLLLYNPVTTTCNHTLCRFCMATWASVSLTEPMTIVDVDEEPVAFDPVSELQARCPMCRTLASASLNVSRAEELKEKYPRTWAVREADGESDLADGEGIQTVTIYIGNRHEWVAPRPDDLTQNQHRWTFFVKSSRTDIIEEVHILLHPTFRPSRIVCQRRPYQITRLGWGVFTITASVILKAGYSWVSDDALDSPDGAPKGMLPLEWMLDFEGFDGKGSMGRCRLKVKNDRDWQDVSEEEAEDNREWTRMVRQYERDGRYEPRR